MMTTTKPNQSDRLKDEFAESKFRRNPILWFILASVLVHGTGLILFASIERSQPVVQKNTNPTPIDFVVIPPEESPPKEQSKTATNPLPKGENQPGKVIEPEPEPPTPAKPVTPSQAIAVPKPVPPSPSPKPPTEIKPEIPPQTAAVPETTPPQPKLPEEIKPEPVTPPANVPAKNQNTAEILSGSDTTIETTETKTPKVTDLVKPPTKIAEPENTSVATRLPPKISPTQPLETDKPASSSTELPATPSTSGNHPPATDSGAASLLGGGFKRSLEDDEGDSFFDLQAKTSQQAYNPALLDEQQNIDMRKYFSEVQRRVRRNWNPKFKMEEYTTVLNFTIQRNGHITGLEVVRTSGSEDMDREALKAIQNSAPFAPLPENFPLDTVNIGFNFNIYIY